MKILHYIDRMEQGDLVSEYVQSLLNDVSGRVETRLLTATEDVEKTLKDFVPDVVHVHGCRTKRAAKVVETAHKMECGILLSPHWQLSQFTSKHEQPFAKTLQNQWETKAIAAQADALLTTSEDERKEVAQLAWNSRIEVIKNCHLSTELSTEEMTMKVGMLYQKIFHTRYRKRMTATDFQCLHALHYAGLTHDKAAKRLSGDDLVALRKLTPTLLTRLFFFADDENIRSFIDAGIEKLQLNLPHIESNKIDRYCSLHPKRGEALIDYDAIGQHEKIGEERLFPLLQTALKQAKHQLKESTFSLRHLTEIYCLLRFNDYNEDELFAFLKRKRLLRFTQRLLFILSEWFYLEEGFMPFAAIEDKRCQTIKEQIINRKYY